MLRHSDCCPIEFRKGNIMTCSYSVFTRCLNIRFGAPSVLAASALLFCPAQALAAKAAAPHALPGERPAPAQKEVSAPAQKDLLQAPYDLNAGQHAVYDFTADAPGKLTFTLQSQGMPVMLTLVKPGGERVVLTNSTPLEYTVTADDLGKGKQWKLDVYLAAKNSPQAAAGIVPKLHASGSIAIQASTAATPNVRLAAGASVAARAGDLPPRVAPAALAQTAQANRNRDLSPAPAGNSNTVPAPAGNSSSGTVPDGNSNTAPPPAGYTYDPGTPSGSSGTPSGSSPAYSDPNAQGQYTQPYQQGQYSQDPYQQGQYQQPEPPVQSPLQQQSPQYQQPSYQGQPAYGQQPAYQPAYQGQQPAYQPAYQGQPSYQGQQQPAYQQGQQPQYQAQPNVPGGVPAGFCAVKLSTDRSTIHMVDSSTGVERKHLSLGQDRVQKVFSSPDNAWSVAVYKVRGAQQYGFIALELSKCEDQLPVDLEAVPSEARFDQAEVVLVIDSKEKHFPLKKSRMQ
jgi:hypothetical protein